MSDNVRRILRLCIAALIGGGITTVSNLLSSFQAGGVLDQKAILVAVLGGVLVLLTNLQASLSEPPGAKTPPKPQESGTPP